MGSRAWPKETLVAEFPMHHRAQLPPELPGFPFELGLYRKLKSPCVLVKVGWLVGKTLATTATHRVQPESATTLLDQARRAKVNTTPQHTYPLTNPISMRQSGY